MIYEIRITKRANKEIQDLSGELAKRVFKTIYGLSAEPRPSGCKKLKGSENEYRLRIGDYRILYLVEDSIKIVEIFKVGHRRNVYD
jgi:mRNA interferase RelE/StbE